MLTKDLLEFRTRKGRVFPKFVAAHSASAPLADELVARLASAQGESRGTIESDLAERAAGHCHPRVAKGLVKLLLDRAEFAEPDPTATDSRKTWLTEAEEVRRCLPSDASFEDYERALNAKLPLDDVRSRLYEDLPERRPMIGFKAIDGRRLLARYDLAQVQGLLMYAERIVLVAPDGDTPELRRVLRWMRFCRLVAEVQTSAEGWHLTIEGPAAILDGAKKYGLQLASFFLVVPVLERWRIHSEVKLPRRTTLTLELSEDSGLTPGLQGGSGHIPPEMRTVLDRWSDSDWTLDAHPAPVSVGVHDWCVPDLVARRGEHSVSIELFHAWHQGALPRRLAALEARPNAYLLIGIDRKLSKKSGVAATAPQCFAFSGFVTERGLKRALADWWAVHGAAGP